MSENTGPEQSQAGGINEEAAHATLAEVDQKFPGAIVSSATVGGEAALVVEPSKWPALAKWLSTEGGFDFLSDLCAVDYLEREPRFEVVYHLTDMRRRRRLRVKLPVPADGANSPKVPSVTSIWPTADWHERETFDMFGIVFEGHPDLRRILMPDQWEGHPLRKDYAMGKVPVEYKSMSPGF